VLCCALVVVACQGDGDDPSTSFSTGSSSTSANGPDLSTAWEVETCGLLTADEVAEATGIAVLGVSDEPPMACVFDHEVETSVFISVDDGSGRASGPEAIFESYLALVDAAEAELVADVGQEAIYAPGYRAIVVRAANESFVAIGINGGYGQLENPREALIALAQIALERI